MNDDEMQDFASQTDVEGRYDGPLIGEQQPPNRARDEEMARLHMAGWTHGDIGVRHGLTKSGVQAALSRLTRDKDRQFGLSVRAYNALRYSTGPVTGDFELNLDDIAAFSFQGLLELPNLGSASAYEIATMLWRRGFVMKGMPEGLRTRLVARETTSNVTLSTVVPRNTIKNDD